MEKFIKINTPPKVREIISSFLDNNYEIYIVGGVIRDIIMGKLSYDWDFTTNATPDEILKLFPDSFYDNQFGTVAVKPEDENERPYEITTFRTEYGYSDSRRPDKVEWGKSLEEDLKRRDLTINAMALKPINIKNGEYELIDLYKGLNDIKNKIVKAVGNPCERFGEDALRMMRAVRIAAQLGFTIDEKTAQAIQDNSPLIHKIASERVKDELFKILSSNFPYEGILILKNVGLIAQIIPELEKTFGVEQKSPGRHHIYDVGNHLLFALKNCPSNNPVVRFATLIHDIGKPQTYKKLETGTITFYNHEMVSYKIAQRIADRLKFSKKEKDLLLTLVRWHQFSVDDHQTDSAIRRFIRKVGVNNIQHMLDLRTGDRLGGGARETSWRLEEFKKRLIEVQKEPFSINDLKIDGNDIMKLLNINPGPKVGEILNKLFKEVEDKKIDNSKEALTSKLKEFNV